MTTQQRRRILLVAGFVMLATQAPSMAADAPKVLNVIAVKLKGDQTAYLDKVKKLNAVMKRLESGATMRVWRATLAGPNAGTLYVGIEYPNLDAYAKATTKVQADEEWNKAVKEMDASGIREVLGNSLMVEITP